MDLLKSIFPYSFGVKDVTDLVVKIIIYVIIGLLAAVLCWVVGFLPFLGGILKWLLGTVAELYVTGGIVFAVLSFAKVLK